MEITRLGAFMSWFTVALWGLMIMVIGVIFGAWSLLRDFFKQLIDMSLHCELDDE